MRLAIPTLILFLYIFTSLVFFLPCRPLVKVAAGLVLLVIGLKYLIYEQIGGSFIAPKLPHFLLLSLEILFGAMVILAFLLVLKDGLALLLWLGRCLGSSWHLPFTPVIRSSGLVLAALGLAFFATWQSLVVPDVRNVEIPLPRLPKSLDGLTIVQLSDIHIGPLLKGDWLKAVVVKTNAQRPDLVVLTGDMIDGYADALQNDIAPLGELQAKYGVYGVTGNHEYYFQAQEWLPVFARLGIVMLDNEHRALSIDGQELVLAGVPDSTVRQFGGTGPDIGRALEGAPNGIRILLKHKPSGPPSGTKVDLQLSGHTHGGHLFFLKSLIASFNGNLVAGLLTLDGMQIYVSPGTGLWSGFSCRLGVPSEITRIILRAKKD